MYTFVSEIHISANIHISFILENSFTLVCTAGDDPFFDPDFWPIEESVDGGSMAPIKMERQKHGGHLGFMFHQLDHDEEKCDRPTSWMPLELARFVSHVHDYKVEE